jgi:hypothetical protein
MPLILLADFIDESLAALVPLDPQITGVLLV